MGLGVVCRLLAVAVLHAAAASAAREPKQEAKVPAVFVLGDSTTDAGNNNYIPDPIYHANNPPNGQDFIPSSGRFANGKLIVDYLCDMLKLPYAPPYLQPGADFRYGVNFASAGSGVLNATHAGRTISFGMQQDNFDKLFKNPSAYNLTHETLQDALYYISITANDYIVYITSPDLQTTISFNDYKMKVVKGVISGIKNLYSKGARKIIVEGIPALGCAPAISLAFNAQPKGKCVKQVQDIMAAHNAALRPALKALAKALPALKLTFSVAFYEIQLEAALTPLRYGFEDGRTACCGVGPFGGVVMCGQYALYGGANVTTTTCAAPDKFAFWDYFHPSSAAYQVMARAMWTGERGRIAPYTVRALAMA